MTITEFNDKLNTWGREQVPFLFLVDFEMKKPLAVRLDDVNPNEILFDINGFTNSTEKFELKKFGKILTVQKISFTEYKKKFDLVYDRLLYGDSFLTNLTIKTEIRLNPSLQQLFHISKARYKLLFKNEFLVFSPETFIQIKNGMIFSFPMKGTIDASLPGARERILNDQKETAEHVTIVDLIRNDLSQTANDVSVKRFRYVDEIKTNTKNLLQVSSEISGRLPSDFLLHLGDILLVLLPAGSVSGAPKPKTLDIIKRVEKEDRGYYTGVFGYFDGERLDSGVMIRFIERNGDKYFYRSGGGITTQSVVDSEHQEAIDKVYVPVD